MAGNSRQSNFEEYQAVNNSIQNVQAQRQQNLSNARMQNMAANGQTDLLTQASGVMVDAMRPVQLNSTTQGILGKYGVQKPQTTRSSSTQQVGGNTTIINNNTTTYNTTTGDYGGPVQGRALAFKQQEAGISKFKLWLDNLFARQKDESARRDREYEKRERALQKEQNKLGRKLEGIGTSLGRMLDQRRNGSMSQIKQLLLMFGIGTLATNFDKVLDGVDKVLDGVDKVKSFLEYFGLKDNKFSIVGSEFEEDTVKNLGGNSGESIGTALKELIIGKEGFLGRIQDGLDIALRERAEAINHIKKPNTSSLKPIEALGVIAGYLGDVLACAIGGAKYANKAAVTAVLTQMGDAHGADTYGRSNDRYTKNINSVARGLTDGGGVKIKDTSLGDYSYQTSNLLHQSDIDSKGNLVNNTGSSLLQGKSIGTLLNETDSQQVHTTHIMSGFQRLKNSARQNGSTIVDDNFLDSLHTLGIGDSREDVKKKIGLENHEYHYNYVITDKTQEEWNKDSDTWAPIQKAAILTGGAIGGVTVASAAVMTGGAATPGLAVGTAMGGEAGQKVEQLVEDAVREGKIIRMVPVGYTLKAGESFLKQNGNVVEGHGYELTPDVVKNIEKALDYIKFDVSDADSMKRLEEKLIAVKKDKLAKAGISNPNIYSDQTSDTFAGALYDIQVGNNIQEKYDKEREELRNRDDRVKYSMFGKTLRDKEWLSESLGEQASPALVDYVSKAERFISARAHGKSKGKCGTYVRNALLFAGADIPTSGMNATKFDEWCLSHGYRTIYSKNSASQFDADGFEPAPGDIVVVGGSRKHNYGHVAMYTSNGWWISDFKQNTPLGLRNPGEYGGVTVYRPTNETVKSLNSGGINLGLNTEDGEWATAEEYDEPQTPEAVSVNIPDASVIPEQDSFSNWYNNSPYSLYNSSFTPTGTSSMGVPDTSSPLKDFFKNQTEVNGQISEKVDYTNKLLEDLLQSSQLTSMASTSIADSNGVIRDLTASKNTSNNQLPPSQQPPIFYNQNNGIATS